MVERSPSGAARFSPCGHYRWWLRRCWRPEAPELVFVGLNPSRADAERDDPTLRRLLGFAHRWGHGSLTVVNLFARVSPSPAVLRRCADPIGATNDDWIHQAVSAASAGQVVWLGWCNGGGWRDRQAEVLDLLLASGAQGRLMSLGLTASGHPRHPLYARADAPLSPFVLTWSQPAAAF